MPKFIIKLWVTNNSGVPIKAHVGASLVGADWTEYYNKSEDITLVFKPGKTVVGRYLTTDLGANQKYKLIVVIWEGEKPIGHGRKYATKTLINAVEKKKKIVANFDLSIREFYPRTFYAV